jgi:hypothetical protein
VTPRSKKKKASRLGRLYQTAMPLFCLTYLMPAPSQAEIAPLTEEPTTEKGLQLAGKRLKGHDTALNNRIKVVYIVPQNARKGKGY